jgi:hypothetical protein
MFAPANGEGCGQEVALLGMTAGTLRVFRIDRSFLSKCP